MFRLWHWHTLHPGRLLKAPSCFGSHLDPSRTIAHKHRSRVPTPYVDSETVGTVNTVQSYYYLTREGKKVFLSPDSPWPRTVTSKTSTDDLYHQLSALWLRNTIPNMDEDREIARLHRVNRTIKELVRDRVRAKLLSKTYQFKPDIPLSLTVHQRTRVTKFQNARLRYHLLTFGLRNFLVEW